ncbi:sensor histidine kinase [Bifidobacterium callimiconis]|uniref:Sensor-like histidine kinase SenX3 n=1 Tax=Bifidobacterium callimiconis TaxID=2306973 RepID=A0A430FDW6_9BIFI|nr:ATP-binding protein [Bifidobacterium callimiconis]RSX51094.1 ATPase [Bifidobacterium callimiconis]
MTTQNAQIVSMVIFVIFCVMLLIAIVALISKLYNWAYPFLSQYINTDAIAHWRASIGFRRSRKRNDDDDDDDDELDFETVRMLSVIPGLTVVVDENDEVLQASTDTYRLGIVNDECLVNDHILQAVHSVRESGGKRSCELVTQTPDRFASEYRFGDDGVDGAASVQQQVTGDGMVVFTRPNWLKVTVGQISETKTLVIINDVSEEHRFAQVREDFVANVTEQLLKPTRALETLGEDLEEDDVDVSQILVEASRVRNYASHLSHLVDDLLLLIKAQSKVVPNQDNLVNLLDQVRTAADCMAPLARTSNVRVIVNGADDIMVHAESEQLQGALGKLIENAIEYSPEHKAVGIAVSRAKDGKHALVRVVDQGCGIPREEQPRIFERFYRGSNQSSRTGDGVGLGLAIVKHVALTHHGSVSVWSAPRQGSTFTFSLPLAD